MSQFILYMDEFHYALMRIINVKYHSNVLQRRIDMFRCKVTRHVNSISRSFKTKCPSSSSIQYLNQSNDINISGQGLYPYVATSGCQLKSYPNSHFIWEFLPACHFLIPFSLFCYSLCIDCVQLKLLSLNNFMKKN